MINKREIKIKWIIKGLASVILCSASQVYAGVGNLLWEDNFNSLNSNTWHVDIGDGCDQGLCGWGNQELQWYGENNVTIENIPGESGNKALVLTAKNEASNGYAFTSGKVESSDKIAVKYGMVEVRMQVPDVDIGLWPGVWMLGTTSQPWPAKGEIDIMEMGHKASARAEAGFPGANINSYVGSNLIFYSDAACSTGNPTCAASTAWQTDNAHVSSTPLTNRFVIYRTYWTDSTIRFTVEDNGVEYDMYDAPFNISEESNEFQAPYYLLLNLAVGGNFTDASSNAQVSAVTPAKMYIDYIRVYELDGQGEVFINDQRVPESGAFGVFTDNTLTNNKLEVGQSSDLYIWNQNSTRAGNLPAAEGNNVIAWHYNAVNEWFGGGINTRQTRDMSNFSDSGTVNFKIKIPADVAFKIGISDTYTNQNWLEFPANTTTYGLIRNGDWAQASIPVIDLRGDFIALQSLEGMFYIASIDGQLPTHTFEMAIDDIVWTGGGNSVVDSDGDGVDNAIDQCPNTPAGTVVDSVGCPIVVSTEGIEQNSNASVTFYVNTIDWADVHYTINGGGQQNFRMTVMGGRNVYALTGLSSGDIINYSYTYISANGIVVDTSIQSHTMSGGTGDIDSDNDGVNDNIDQCPNTPAGTAVDSVGCALVLDSDNDGVNDNIDQCPNTLAGTIVDSVGCALVLDSDNDGVNDGIDQCPNTPAGTIVNNVGCAIPAPQPILVEAEDYIDSYDTTEINIGGEYRVGADEKVDIEKTTDEGEGFNVGWTESGEWLKYIVNLSSGTYNVTTRVASAIGGGNYELLLNGNVFANDTVNNTGGWQDFYSHSLGQITVAEGSHIIRLNVISAGFNINWLKFNLTNGDTGGGDSDNDGVNDNVDQCPNTPAGEPVNSLGCPVVDLSVTPLYDGSTVLEGIHQEHTATALITRYGDRPRTRHAKENEFQSYDHYIAHYFERRSSSMEIIDRVAKGGQGITLNVRTVWPISSQREGRVWYMGWGTVADYIDNSLMQIDTSRGDSNGFDGTHYHYTKEININPRKSPTNNSTPGGTALGMHGDSPAIAIGDLMEFEISQFSGTRNGEIIGGQTNYYGSTFLYIVGKGIVPWYTENTGEMVNATRHQAHYQEDSRELPEEYRLGGDTTVPYQYTHEPDNYFMQMALNIDYDKSQKFLEGRRVFHSSFANGQHDEFAENGTFTDVTNLIGAHHVNESCSGCHQRNGGAAVEANGVLLERWVFKIGNAVGAPDANRGRVLQPRNNNGSGEGDVSIAQWIELGNGLRTPTFNFSSGQPATFSARISPRLVGLGLLEAIKEEDVLALEQAQKSNVNGVSGRANLITDPKNSGLTRLGRFGWKASTISVEHQVAGALNTDMGVKTSLLPTLDCGSNQSDCNSGAPALDDTNLDKLVYYVQALAVRAQRGLESGVENQSIKLGKKIFDDTGCADCHTPLFKTSEFHPLVEVRNQTIQPYTDLLVHDMGDGLADNLGEGLASGREWRTTPLWGLGLSLCVTNGVINPQGGEGNEICNEAPGGTYLHDGRARTIREAILWHGSNGSEALNATNKYQALSATEKDNLHNFLEAL